MPSPESVERIEPARLEEAPAAVADLVAELTVQAATLGRAVHLTTPEKGTGLLLSKLPRRTHLVQIFPKTVFDPVPEHLSNRQRMAVYALRFAAHAVELAHSRLLHGLRQIDDADLGAELESKKLSCLLDAWSTIDNAHRLYMVLNSFPGLRGLKLNDKRFQLFRGAENLRHFYEHMEALASGTDDAVVFSGLSWLVQDTQESKEFAIKFHECRPIRDGTIRFFKSPIVIRSP